MAVLVDGDQLLDPTERHRHIGRVRRAWIALEQVGYLERGRRFQLVLTKVDRLDHHAEGSAAEAVFKALADELAERYPHLNLETFKVAARPPQSGDLPFGFGLEPLVQSWLTPEPTSKFVSPIRHIAGGSVFDAMTVRFAART